MTIYQFKDDAGNLVELDYTMESVPSIGDSVDRDGKTLTRVFSTGTEGSGIIASSNQYPYLSNRLNPKMPGVELVKSKTGRMKPMIRNRQHERELIDRHGLERE